MPSIIRKIGVMSAAAALAVLTAAAPATALQATPAYFTMTDITREQFVVQLTDPADIQHARDLLSGATDERPHLYGRIDKRTASYNPRWSYHFRPETVDFFEVAIEVCDASIPYVEDHLDEAGGAFLPGLIWCPWSSRLVNEISAP
ncbi:calmodulin-binding protein [Nonomuraea sp. NPDC049725]|uniref:BP74-related protein n=1 Tax=Nonomuraea sp. NPDC049725 TaxID=3154508 RepID=UPI00343ACBCB